MYRVIALNIYSNKHKEITTVLQHKKMLNYQTFVSNERTFQFI